MALSMQQAYALQGMGSLGYVQAIAAIVGPLAQGGADIYKTSSDSKQNRKELKQRQREFLVGAVQVEPQKTGINRGHFFRAVDATKGRDR